MSQFTYEWHDGPFAEPIQCLMSYQEPEPSAFPGAQGEACELVSMSLCGIELPLSVLTPLMRGVVETYALDWLKEEHKDQHEQALLACVD